MEIEVGPAISETEIPDAAQPMQLRLFRARWLRGGPELHDHDRVGWFDVDELQQLDWHTADTVLLEALLRNETLAS